MASTDDCLRVKFLFAKDIIHYVIRNQNDERHEKLEQSMQQNYNLADMCTTMFEIGDYVAVYLKLDAKRKLWVRAKVDNVYNAIAGFLYSVYLLDYGVKKCVQKQNIRSLKSFMTHVFVPYRAIHFFVSDIKASTDLKDKSIKEVVKELHTDLKSLNNTLELSAIIKRSDTFNDIVTYYGNIEFSNGSDLRSFLVDKGLAVDSNSNIECNEVKRKVLPITKTCGSHTKIKEKPQVIRLPIRQPIRCPFPKPSNISINKSVNSHNGDCVDCESRPIATSSVTRDTSQTNLRRKKLLNSLKQLNISKEDSDASSRCSDDTSHSDLSSLSNSNKEVLEKEEPIDWPEFEKTSSHLMLKPAGCQPPVVDMNKYGKYYTLTN